MKKEEINENVIKNKNSTAQMIEGDIFNIHYKGGINYEIQDFKEGIEAFHTLTKGKPVRVLIEFGKYASGTPEARKFVEENNVTSIAEAVVINSLAQRILVRFYQTFRKQNQPMKIFDSREKALEWLDTFVSK